ncbi:2-octaprenyl-6-methoxyphenyl hydroxylase [Burkholderia sp. WAC0059]|uniref:UbiH/UbiF/VisC/COQ6 family ubiquinone biosynthesis hydroxylase n=1 Tax=Burkholderia sp. WAC0059 TaxID=2066022 RepID=UPI000C7F192B|nr:UbiH/UbiF/VisC/COQ6 family ubiquinone biosynthesis hydroxylase [Burkholderia sp. WAC0059]PLZ03309.1 2-octaprenyl-6-methoxyphenyl hydroxylase [Burkholderia sp. WAC0059]
MTTTARRSSSAFGAERQTGANAAASASADDANSSPADDAPFDYDVTIVGAGPVGLALAGWLAKRTATQSLSLALVDAREPADSASDPRAIAVSHGSRTLLDALAWPRDATPIERIHVSQRGHFGRTLIDRADYGLTALGYVARYGAIVEALAAAVRTTPARWLHATRAFAPAPDGEGVTLSVESAASGARTLRTRILVNAEGGLFRRPPAGDDAIEAASRPADERLDDETKRTRDYGQTALVGVVTAAAPRPHVAWERFTPEGPIALLPMGGTRGADYALVWCCAPAEGARRAQLSDEDFLAELDIAFGARMGRFTAVRGRAAFPLGLSALDTLVKGRIVAVGNAAQTLHPVAGQGLNLGLRDAHALVDALAQHGATPLALAEFARRRALDRRLTIGATDTLARLFTVDSRPLATLRGLALTALEFAPPVKTALARHMMFGQRR